MIESLKLIYRANNSGITLWVEDGKLKSRFPKSFGDKEFLSQLSKNKESIISILENNKVFSSEIKLPYIYKDEIAEKHSLSFAQERLWFIEQYEQGTNAYHIPLLVELEKDTDKGRLKNAIQQVVERHEVLRTVFQQEEQEYVQLVRQEILKIREYSYKDTNIEDQIVKDINTPFDLQNEIPIRVRFYNQKERIQLLMTIHHIASDGWSEDVLLKEIDSIYRGEVLPSLNIQYKDFSIWQREYLQGDLLKKQQDYWREKLAGYEPLGMPTDKIRPKQVNYSGADELFSLNAELSNKLRSLSKEQGCTMYTTLLSGFYILLNKYTGQDDIVLGTPIANRHYSEIQDLIGFFVNSLALREQLNSVHTITELLSQVQNNLIEAQRSQDIPFEKIVETIGVTQDSSRHPIFQVMFGVQSFGGESVCSLFKESPLNDTYAIAKYDLSCFMDDSQQEIQGSFNYATSLYKQATIERMINHYQLVLEQMVNEQDKQLKDYELLCEDEHNKIVIDWNNTSLAYPFEKTIYQLVEEQVLKTPNKIAAVFEQEKLTYAELNAKANQLARYLRAQTKITPDTLIALCLDRSLDMIIGILGVQKAGGAYVPIDPEYPSERISYILEDTKTGVILTQSHLVEGLKKVNDVRLITLNTKPYQKEQSSNLVIQNRATDLAYVIYTSGTTGKPKGAVVTHQLLVNRLVWQKQTYDFNESDTILQKTPYVFDVSVWELLLPLISGSTLLFAKVNGHKEPEYLYHIIESQKVTKLHFVPSMLTAFVAYLKNNNDYKLSSVKEVFCSGEALSVQLATDFKNLFPNIQLNNLYGPTEVAIDVSFYNDIQANTAVIPIGKPIQNIKFYVLDANKQAVPIGVVGELFIAAQDLSRGYLNRPELSAEKFISNPFASQAEIEKGYTHLYKTGDLVKWLPDGNIEYIGRNDFQVKIRGFRIELGEIENTINSIDGITQVCVLAKERNGSKYLVAYFTSKSAIKKASILKLVSAQLPEYMMPSILVELEQFPLTINGKLDQKALPEAAFTNEDSYKAPSTDLEIKICEIWQDVLNLKKVGVTDDFFRIGGDSILSIQLSSRLRKHDFNCSVRAIFDHRTISKLAQFISEDVTTIEVTAEQGYLEGEFNLLPIQQWFFDKIGAKQLPEFNHWNQSFLVKVPQLDTHKLQEVIANIVAQHDILRVVFGDRNQRYLSEVEIPEAICLHIGNESEQEIVAKLTNLQSSFNINKSPLWTIAYVDGYQDDSARLFFAFHHLIIDTVSWRILIEDFKSLYHGSFLEKKSSSYRQWVNEISKYEEKYPKEKAYWDGLLKRVVSIEIEEKQVESSKTKLTKKQTKNLLRKANKAYHTEVNDLLLTALGLTLQNWNNLSSQFITLEGHGREDLNETIDHSSTVGWFTTLYPVELKLENDISSSIKSIKESLRTIPNKGIGFGAMYPGELINLPRISFNYLGQFDSQDEYWHVVSESSGMDIHTDNVDSTLVNINGIVVAGKLRFQVDSKLGLEQTKVFAQDFEKYLSEVIAHCLTQIENNDTKHTQSDFETVTISQSLLDEIQKDMQIEAIYLANSLQQGFVYHALSQKEDDAYRVQILFDYKQALDVTNYIKSWELAVEKHPILRTGFNWEEEIIQIVYTEAELIYQISDISHLSGKERNQQIVALQEADRKIAFDLRKPCLLRLHIIKQSRTHYTILKSEHHSISDGWSGSILLNTVHENYEQLQQGHTIKITADDSYGMAQRYYAKHRKSVDDFWYEKSLSIEQVNDLTPLLSCKQDLDIVKSLETPFDTSIEISGSEYHLLKKLTKTEGLTLSTFVQFAWHKLIQEYTQDHQTIVGTTVSGRDIPVSGIEESVGLYINTLPLIVDWNNENTVLEQIQYLHQQITEINSHSFANLADLQKEGKRLFHSLLVFENYPMSEDKEQGEDKLHLEFRYGVEKLDYPIGITAYEQGEKLVINLKSDRDILNEEQARFNLSKIELLLNQLTLNLDKKHAELSTITKEEYQQIVIDWNDTDVDYPKDTSIHELFEQQVLKTPEAVAVVFESQQLSYQELNTKSNLLARYISKQTKVHPDTLIAICLDRSLEMIISIMGVLKSGAAYVPIDPAYPLERINYILEDTKTNLVLTQSEVAQRLTESSKLKLIEVDSILDKNIDVANLNLETQSNDLAYVIYTSGTTGNPKGVMVEHASVCNYIQNIAPCFEGIENVDYSSNFSFDLSVTTTLVPLLMGKRICIYGGKLTEINKYVEHLRSHKIDFIKSTPSFLTQIPFAELTHPVKSCFIGGEKSDTNQLTFLNKYISNVYDEYGPTEATVGTTTILNTDAINSIGKPYSNYKIYVLGTNKKPVPTGVVGELHIGGAGLARGYLNQPELTTEKFISNPFASQADIEKKFTRLYKTGDTVRWLPNGNLEYIGRNDDQVKIRGYRIELGEIEHAINAIDEVKQACVLAREKNGNKYLVGYFVSDGIITKEEISEYLSNQLPDYMVPRILIELDAFPLTINGKLDRNALPETEFTNEDSYEAPSTDLEIKICEIWQDVLNLEKIGITDNFFQIGGNSILAIKLIVKMNKILSEEGEELSITYLFKYKNIKNLLSNLSRKQKSNTLIKKMNADVIDNETLFFVHPGKGGCEVYMDLAYKLKNELNSYGIDNFNIINEKSILNLNLLAEKYIDALIDLNVTHMINLCSWSFGGQIALEMGYILEQRGFRNINIYLLDTLIRDEHLLQLLDKYDEIENIEIHNAQMISNGLDEAYASKVLRASKAEKELGKQPISGMLKSSCVILFKALQHDTRIDFEGSHEIQTYIQKLEDNNVGQFVENLEVVNLDCHHGNIIEHVLENSEYSNHLVNKQKELDYL